MVVSGELWFRRVVAHRTTDLTVSGGRDVPFQCVLSTKAGTECVSHILQTLTDMDFLSVDGIVFFYHSMLRGLMETDSANSALPTETPILAKVGHPNLGRSRTFLFRQSRTTLCGHRQFGQSRSQSIS